MQTLDVRGRPQPGAGGPGTEFRMPDVIGGRREVPLLDGRRVPQAFLDNAASTKPLGEVSDFMRAIERYYSNIHRGTGHDSVFCTQRSQEARQIVTDFVGGDPERDVAVPVRNSTEGLNLLATSFDFSPDDVVLTSLLEHHSNDLPWRGRARVEHISLREDATFDTDRLERRLEELGGKVRVVAISGASNVTGEVLPIHTIASLAHRHGARIVVDAAQLAPHRAIAMRSHDDPDHLDFVVFSAHKMNAPYGEGAIVGPRDHFCAAAPYLQGGGAVYAVGLDHVVWADTPERQEAGTPNILGLFALAAVIRTYQRIGWDRIVAHEKALTRRLLKGMAAIEGVSILGPQDADRLDDRLGVVTFAVGDLHHHHVAAILSYEHGVAVRAGCFCAHPLIKHLLRVTPESERDLEANIALRDRRFIPGAVRVSIGLHNDIEEIDRFLFALGEIAAGRWMGEYVQDRETGEFWPKGFRFDFADCPAFPAAP